MVLFYSIPPIYSTEPSILKPLLSIHPKKITPSFRIIKLDSSGIAVFAIDDYKSFITFSHEHKSALRLPGEWPCSRQHQKWNALKGQGYSLRKQDIKQDLNFPLRMPQMECLLRQLTVYGKIHTSGCIAFDSDSTTLSSVTRKRFLGLLRKYLP